MKIKDIRKLKSGELEKKLADLQSELINLHGQSATGTPPKSPGQIKKVKLMIARIKTIKREQEIADLKAGKVPDKKTEKEVIESNARD